MRLRNWQIFYIYEYMRTPKPYHFRFRRMLRRFRLQYKYVQFNNISQPKLPILLILDAHSNF